MFAFKWCWLHEIWLRRLGGDTFKTFFLVNFDKVFSRRIKLIALILIFIKQYYIHVKKHKHSFPMTFKLWKLVEPFCCSDRFCFENAAENWSAAAVGRPYIFIFSYILMISREIQQQQFDIFVGSMEVCCSTWLHYDLMLHWKLGFWLKLLKLDWNPRNMRSLITSSRLQRANLAVPWKIGHRDSSWRVKCSAEWHESFVQEAKVDSEFCWTALKFIEFSSVYNYLTRLSCWAKQRWKRKILSKGRSYLVEDGQL